MAPFKSPQSDKGKFKKENKPKVSTNRDTPLFNLEYLDSRYSLSECTKDEKAAFADTLARLGKVIWAEIVNAPRKGIGHEIIPWDQIKSGKPSHITPEIRFLAFRFCGNAPMVGYREGRIFYIVWLDRAFTLYDHG